MANLPIRRSRRYELIKFIYTADNGDRFITGQFNYKDDLGIPFIELTPLFNQRIVDEKKTKLWGNTDNLRRCEVVYQEPRNQTGQAEARFYLPYPPSQHLTEHLEQIRQVLKSKFNDFNLSWCTNYRGETRFTFDKPIRINPILE
jgi:hypothetical protein